MKPRTLVFLVGVLVCAQAQAQNKRSSSKITLPLARYNDMQRRLAPAAEPAPPVPMTCQQRTLDGVFRKGLLSATLTARLTVLDRGGHVWVPVLDAAAIPQRALVDGKPTTLVKRRGMYVIGVDRPGTYQVKLRFLVGREQDRFARRLLMRLPKGCPTKLSVPVPERGIEAWLRRGALTGQSQVRGAPDGFAGWGGAGGCAQRRGSPQNRGHPAARQPGCLGADRSQLDPQADPPGQGGAHGGAPDHPAVGARGPGHRRGRVRPAGARG